MKKLTLSMMENAIDSLEEGLSSYTKGVENIRMYKFSILNISHFLELALKACVQDFHVDLVFSDVLKEVKEKEKKEKKDFFQILSDEQSYLSTVKKKKHTITAKNAADILGDFYCTKNKNYIFPKSEKEKVVSLINLRNEIMHYECLFEDRAVRLLIGSALRIVNELFDYFNFVSLEKAISAENRPLLEDLLDEYEHLTNEAKLDIQAKLDDYYKDIYNNDHIVDREFLSLDCSSCGGIGTMVEDKESSTGIRCVFEGCGNEDSSDTPVECDECGSRVHPDSIEEMTDSEGIVVHSICDSCWEGKMQD